ncbi:phage shock protein PspA [Candidatus Sumerlaeota bacterium]|nr:phage shock protein PspA [Candidatus Sumerlaeota bacterium]
MGIFTRLRDIISSNINAMLDKAEDPEKLLRLMIQEMEDTLIEIKANCASAMAQSKTFGRLADEARERAAQWGERARLAMQKGRDDLAREALLEKRRHGERADSFEIQKRETDALVEQYQNDITQLEAKMASVREKQKVLVQRHVHARAKRRAQEHIRRADTADVMARVDGFEKRIDRLEAEADLVNFGRPVPLEQEFDRLVGDEELEKELEKLRAEVKGGSQQ